MNHIILDLEATCWEDRSLPYPNEIIEIGALKIDSAGQTLSEFAAFVKPKLHPQLSDFCRDLTTIEQAQVDSADGFTDVVHAFQAWIDLAEPYVLGSWGFYDRKQLRKDCLLHGIDPAWLRPHISLKHQFAHIKQLPKPVGMGGALKREGLTLEGTHHRGIDDARNIAKIFVAHLEKWELVPND